MIITSVHQGQPVLTAGALLREATAALVMLHGRGASAEDILSLADHLNTNGFICLAPQAAGGTWYPNRFTEPVLKNEPYLSSALQAVDDVFGGLAEASLTPDKVILLGFSQGACLALEYAARHPRRYGGVAGFSGGLIGNGDQPREYTGSLAGTPVFLGCSNVDPHIPVERVYASAITLREMGALVEESIYTGMGHTINLDELEHLQRMMDHLHSA